MSEVKFPRIRATWLYDAEFAEDPKNLKSDDGPTSRNPYNKGGLWAPELKKYNNAAEPDHQINTLFTYGGGIEMYCRGTADSDYSTECTIDFNNPTSTSNTMFVYYDDPKDGEGDTGKQSTNAYFSAGIPGLQYIMPIIDGRLDNPPGKDDLLSRLNTDGVAATALADRVAQIYGAESNVSGVQVDLEPFDILKPGQFAFYRTLNENFQGLRNKDFGCKNEDRPQGLFFSNFSYPGSWDSTGTFHPHSDDFWNAIRAAFLPNGFFGFSGYDLGPGGPAVINTPDMYTKFLTESTKEMLRVAEKFGISFMVGIPGAASTKEFESTWEFPGTTTNPSGFNQLDYIKIAIQVFKDLGLYQNPSCVGFSIWGWSKYMSYPPHSNNLFGPNTPPQDILDFLKTNY